jgi:hypothetical protein
LRNGCNQEKDIAASLSEAGVGVVMMEGVQGEWISGVPWPGAGHSPRPFQRW